MGLKNLDLIPESPGIFNAGELFRATLSFEIGSKAPVSVQSMQLDIEGTGPASTSVFHSCPDLTWQVSELQSLAPGPYSVELKAALPPSLPPTSRLIEYEARLSLVLEGQPKPFKLDGVSFVVQGYLDLNAVPGASAPVRIGGTAEAAKSGPLSCCSRGTGSFELDLSLPRGGYVPGDYIRLVGTIQNNSPVRLHVMRLFLEQRYGDEEKPFVGVVAQEVVPIDLSPGHRRVIQGAALQIPFTPITRPDQISYVVRVAVDGHPRTFAAAVTIGSEPLAQDIDSS